MRARDLAIVGGVVVLVGFAVFDAVRGGGSTTRDDATVPTRSIPTPPETTATEPVPEPLPRGVLNGALLYVNVSEEGFCSLRLVYLRTGEEARFPQDTTGCTLAAPPTGTAVAKSVEDVFDANGALPYRIIDPEHTERDFLEVRALDGVMQWSLDGERALWCAQGAGAPDGFELELPRTIRPIGDCARGYTNRGERVYVRRRGLYVAERLALERPGGIEEFAWSANGSLALVVGRRVERWSDGRLDAAVALPEGLRFAPTSFSPDNCAAVVLAGQVYVFDLGCFRGRKPAAAEEGACGTRIAAAVRCFPWTAPSASFGHNSNLAAWSPDGEWIAVVEADAIVFHRVVGVYASLRWEVRAATLAWR